MQANAKKTEYPYSVDAQLDRARAWPEVTGEMIDRARREAQDRLLRFWAMSSKTSHTIAVVTRYMNNADETMFYACEQLVKSSDGGCVLSFKRLQDHEGIGVNRIRYLQDDNGKQVVPAFWNCVRIEVIDLGLHINRQRFATISGLRGRASAHFAVIYAAVHDPSWFKRKDGKFRMPVVAAGLELNGPSRCAWLRTPSITCTDSGHVDIGTEHVGSDFSCIAVPTMWE